MAKARALDKRRKSIRNIRKITRTMELIATARFKKAMDRAHAAAAYTQRITRLVADLVASGLEVSHPLLDGREKDRTGRAVGAHGQSRPVRRLQLERAASRPDPLSGTATGRCRRRTGSIGQAGNRRTASFVDWCRPDLTHFEDKPTLRRSRRAGQSLFASLRRRPDRSARRGLHAVRKRQPAGRGRSRRCCRSARWQPRRRKAAEPPAPPEPFATSFCLRPRAFWPRSCRPASR